MKELLLNALEQGQFELHVQLIFNVHKQRLTGGEALARWRDPARGLLTPGMFLPDLTRYGLVDRLDFYMLEQCCKTLAAWKGTELDRFAISSNFSRLTLTAPDFYERFSSIVDRYDFDRTRFTVEITEDALLSDRELSLKNITLCKAAGFRIAIDDLGAGFSSLNDLCDFPVDVVKVDRALIKRAVRPKGATLLKGLVQLSHSLSMPVLCEGAETYEELIAAFESGCDYVQGFYFSKVYDLQTAAQRYLAQTYE